MTSVRLAGLVLGGLLACSLSTVANAGACVTKSAEATSGTADQAKWFALETMVQSVSWGLWPGYVATNKVEGYTVKNQQYKCSTSGAGTTCRGNATFCKNS